MGYARPGPGARLRGRISSESLTGLEWLALPIGAIWLAVIAMSLFAPDLVAGADSTHFKVAALVNWLWGGVATAFVLRATLFLPGDHIDWDESPALIWIGAAVGAIWLIVTIISLAGPEVVYDTWRVPVAAILAPVVGVIVTRYATEFLVAGFAGVGGADID